MRTVRSIIDKSFDKKVLYSLFDIGKMPELENDEKAAMGDGSFILLQENLVIHNRSNLTIIGTKCITESFDLTEFMETLMSAISFDFWCNIGYYNSSEFR